MPDTIFDGADLSDYTSDSTGDPITLGMQFYAAGGEDGWRVLKGLFKSISGSHNYSGAHMYLYDWSAGGSPLAVEPITISPGVWNEVTFDSPIAMNEWPSGHYYLICIHLPHGCFLKKEAVFLAGAVVSPDNANLKAASYGEASGNGVFSMATVADPSNPGVLSGFGFAMYNQTHYGLDVSVLEPGEDPPGGDVAPDITGTPTINTDGTPVTGETVTVTPASVSGSPTPTRTYQWKRGGTNISGATASSYVLQVADEGLNITVTQTETNTEGTDSATSSAITPSAPPVGAPANSVAPVVSGSTVEGHLLSSTNGTWSNTPTSYSYQWQRDGSNISGATSSTYTTQTADIDHAVRCRVTATNGSGSASANSNAITIVAATEPDPSSGANARLAVEVDGEWFVIDSGGNDKQHILRFYPEDYDAKRDGKSIYDAAITNGQSTLTSATANFTSEDVGKLVMINGAGQDIHGHCLSTTITAVTNSTTVTLGTSASATVTGARCTYGTNDAQALRDMFDDAFDQCIADDSRYFEIMFSSGQYCVGGATVKGGQQLSNALIPFRYIPDTDAKVSFALRGTRGADTMFHWNQVKDHHLGAVVRSFVVGAPVDDDWQVPAVFAGPTTLPSPANRFSNVYPIVDGLAVIQPRNPSMFAFDFYLCAQATIENGSASVDGLMDELHNEKPTNTNGCALRMPKIANNNLCRVDSFFAAGHYYGMGFADHTTVGRVATFYCVVGLLALQISSAFEHGASILNASVESTETALKCIGGSGGTFPIFIGQLNMEVVNTGPEIDDPNDCLRGTIYFTKNNGAAPINVNGAHNLQIIDQNQPRGATTAPNVPATTVALKNPFYRDAAVHVFGGTVTEIDVDGANVGVTEGMVLVPSGHEIELTYSSEPDWAWTLL